MVANGALVDGRMNANKPIGGGLKVQQRRKIVVPSLDQYNDTTATTGLACVSHHPKNGKRI